MDIRIVEVLPDQETVGFENLTLKVRISPVGTRMEVVIYFDP